VANRSATHISEQQTAYTATDRIPLWQILTIAGAVILMYLPILIGLVEDWYIDDNYSHGFLIIPISAWLIWRKREELRKIPIQTCKWGLAVVVGSLILFVVGTAGAD